MIQDSDFLTSLLPGGHDPSRLIFEDELTGIHNRRFLHHYFQHKVAWDFTDGWPLSLLLIDVDHFKHINDGFGHQAGDQALLMIAKILKEEAGTNGIPIRYGGDEFVVLLPGGTKTVALDLGRRLLERVRETPINVEGDVARISLSIGAATAPDDATDGKALVQRADLALYQSKRNGRDRLSDASELAAAVSERTVVQQLTSAALMAGRSVELAEVIEAVSRLKHGGSEMLLLEGAGGMGKTTLLEAVRTRLVASGARVVLVKGVAQEAYRPYYLASSLVAGLLTQRADRGASLLESLTPDARSALGHLIPRIVGAPGTAGEPGASDRERIFNAVTDVMVECARDATLAVLIDDLQYADEATLMVLRRLIRHPGLRALVCGATTDAIGSGQEERRPLERFCQSCRQELGIRTVVLFPLTDAEIATYLRALFRGMQAPAEFTAHLSRVTQGNPLFLSELLRKLLADGKVGIEEGRWVLRPLDEGYLPQSLEEIIREKLSALEEENRSLLAHACAVGEDLSLSFLVGSSDTMEAKVLEFVDRAAELGLMRTDFQLTDETVQFLGKRVLEIVYGDIEPVRKQQIHERIGAYQETLYRDGLMPSASYLAYHFKRSANQEKARLYEQAQALSNARVFNAEEAERYAESGGDQEEADRLARVSVFVRSLQTSVGTVRLYAAESERVRAANRVLADAIEALRGGLPRVEVAQAEQTLMVNGRPVDISEYEFDALMCLKLLDRLKLRRVVFEAGFTEQELGRVVVAFGHVKPETIGEEFWPRFCAEQSLQHVTMSQAVAETVRGRAMPLMRGAEEVGEAAPAMPAPAMPEPMDTRWAVEKSAAPMDPDEPLPAFLRKVAQQLCVLLPKDDHVTADACLGRLGRALKSETGTIRDQAITACRELFRLLPVGFHQTVIRRLTDPLTRALSEEKDPSLLAAMASLSHRMAATAIQFDEHGLATRLFAALSERRRLVEQRQDGTARALVRSLDLRPDPSIEKVLAEDLKSGEAHRHERAAQVLGSLGPSIAPVLVEIIRQQQEFRPRQLAARVLADLGSRGAALFKRELVDEAPPVERARMLEVADLVTPSLRAELSYALGESNAQVQDAAFHLAQRMNEKDVWDVLVESVASESNTVAVNAMRVLGLLKPGGSTDVLLGALRSTKQPERLVACCEALGRMADPASVEPLSAIASPKGFLFLRKRWPVPVRAAAASALRHVPDPRVKDIMAVLAMDVDPRLRAIGRQPS